jgi:hypothetical protein
MFSHRLPFLFAVVAGMSLLDLFPTRLTAGTVPSQIPGVEVFAPFEKGNMEFNLAAGHWGSVGTEGTAQRPNVAWIEGSAHWGWMLTSPDGSGIFRGNWELMLGAFGAGVYDGPGDYIVGASLGLRYNFVRPDAVVVPFIQVGGGGA